MATGYQILSVDSGELVLFQYLSVEKSIDFFQPHLLTSIVLKLTNNTIIESKDILIKLFQLIIYLLSFGVKKSHISYFQIEGVV